jgi:hypothetical protein
MTLAKLLLVSATALSLTAATAGRALADGDDAAGGDPAAAPADPNGGAPAAAPTPPPGEGAAAEGWTQEIISRPLTLPKGMMSGELSLDIAHISVTILTTTASATGESLGLGAAYGVSDKLEVGVNYHLTLNDGADHSMGGGSSFEAKGPLAIHGAYGLMHGKLSLDADAAFIYDLLAKSADINLGANVRYMVTPQLAVISPGYQLKLGIVRDDPAGTGMVAKPMSLTLPVGVAFQANKQIYAYVLTNLANIKIADSANAFIFSDRTPLALGAFFSPSNKLDVGAQLDFVDLAHAGDFWAISLMARLYKM